MASTASVSVSYISCVIGNFSLSPLLLHPLSLFFFFYFCMFSVVLSVYVSRFAPSDLACPFTPVWHHCCANLFGALLWHHHCAAVTNCRPPLWLCSRSIDNRKHNGEAHGHVATVEACFWIFSFNSKIVTEELINTVIYRPSLCQGAHSCPCRLIKDRLNPKKWRDVELYIRKRWF